MPTTVQGGAAWVQGFPQHGEQAEFTNNLCALPFKEALIIIITVSEIYLPGRYL